MCCSGSPVSRLGVTAGLLSFLSIFSAVVTGSWLYTKEPLSIPGSKTKSSVSFKIGLWRVCPAMKRVLTSPNTLLPIPGCQLIPYTGWREVKEVDLGITWSSLEFTPSLITKMRYATPLVALAAAMLGLATLLAVLGHCHNDFRTLIACGLHTIGGLVLSGGLVVFISTLSDSSYHPEFHHRYGRSFHLAAASCVLSQAAAMLSVSAFLRRFPTGEAMVRAVVPGADRQLGTRRVYTTPLSSSRDVCVVESRSRPTVDLPHRWPTVIHQGLLGVARGSSSSESSPSCSQRTFPFPSRGFSSLPRPPKFPRIEDSVASSTLPRRTFDSVASSTLPRRTFVSVASATLPRRNYDSVASSTLPRRNYDSVASSTLPRRSYDYYLDSPSSGSVNT